MTGGKEEAVCVKCIGNVNPISVTKSLLTSAFKALFLAYLVNVQRQYYETK